MVNSVVLDNVAHKDLRVKLGYSELFGDNVNTCMVFPTEFAFVQREYPILFRRDPKGDLQPIALLGFDRNENLFLAEGGWEARYVPAMQQRGPFMIGLRQAGEDGSRREPLVNVDLDHPRISRTEGQPLFLPQGGHSPYLEHVSRLLQLIFEGNSLIRPMFAAFEDAGLIEPLELDTEVRQSTKLRISGLETISQECLAKLDAAALERLHKSGFLQLATLVVASIGNIAWLVELKNRRRAAAAAG